MRNKTYAANFHCCVISTNALRDFRRHLGFNLAPKTSWDVGGDKQGG